MLQSVPPNPTLQAQTPVVPLHVPYPEQLFRQLKVTAVAQFEPVHPELQAQTPVAVLQTPLPEQLEGQAKT